jgi:predicted TPR repeat methyltransferase
VKRLFDAYAPRFDSELESLGYRAPQLLRQALAPHVAGKQLEILDLGCGTGLCGALFKGSARSLSGVDLSAQMLAKARARAIYDELFEADLLTVLRAAPARYELILAADVFTYLGELEDVFRAARQALRMDGLFAFTVEAHDGMGHTLRQSGRFAHSAEYLRRLARACALREVSVNEATLRSENGAPITGYVCVFAASD